MDPDVIRNCEGIVGSERCDSIRGLFDIGSERKLGNQAQRLTNRMTCCQTVMLAKRNVVRPQTVIAE